MKNKTLITGRLMAIALAVLVSVPLCLCGQTTAVLFSMQNLVGTAANYSILVQPDESYGTPLWWGTNLIPTQAFTIQPVGGQVTTNLVPWGYTITVDGWPRGVHIVVPVSTNTLNVVSLINTNQFSPLNLTVTNVIVGGSQSGITNYQTGVTLGSGIFGGDFTGPGYYMLDTPSGQMMGQGLWVNGVGGGITNQNGVYYGNGSGLTFLPGANVVGSVPSAAAAMVATNVVVGITLTNANTINESASGSFSGNGVALSNLNASALSGQIQLANGALTVIITNGSTPFDNTNWYCISMYANQEKAQIGYNPTLYTLTNCPFVELYSGWPTSTFYNGNFYALAPWVDAPVLSAVQTQESRVKVSTFGNQLGFSMVDTYGSNPCFWYRTDGSSWTAVNFPNATYYAYVQFTFRTYGYHNAEIHWNAGGLMGVHWPVTNALVNSSQAINGIVVGDSITDGSAYSYGETLWPYQAQNLLEQYNLNLVGQGEGGTGYFQTNGANGAPDFLTRITNCVLNWNPSFVIWAGGVNDPQSANVLSVTNVLYIYATNCFGIVKSRLPNCKQLVIGSWPSAASPQSSYNSSLIISNAAAVFGLPFLAPATTNNSWVNTYNAPWYINTVDNIHPTILGSQFYGYQVANFILTNLITNAAPNLW